MLFERESSSRTLLYFGGASDTFDVDDLDFNLLDCSLFHVGYLLLLPMLDRPDNEFGTRMGRLLNRARKHGCRTSLDMVSERSTRAQSLLLSTLPYVDDLIINEVEASISTGIPLRNDDGSLDDHQVCTALKLLKNSGVTNRVIIHAPEASFGTENGESIVKEQGTELPSGYIQGTVGAGDAFDAGILLAHHQGLTLMKPYDTVTHQLYPH